MVGIGTTFCSSACTLSGPTSSTVLRSVKETFSTTRPITPRKISSTPTRARGFIPRKRKRPVEVASALDQQLAALLDGGPGARGQLGIAGAADRVLDLDEGVTRHAEHAAHQFGGAGEAHRHHADGGDALA